MKKKTEWKRNCPECGKEIPYSTKGNKNKAERKNTSCRLCAAKGQVPWNKGIPRTEEEKKNMSENHSHYWSGKKREPFTNEHKKNISKSRKGMIFTDEHKKNMRLSAIRRRGIKFPNHNPVACGIINDYNKKYNFNFRHAENGGEVCIDGYFPDGLDEKRKTIIEIDEPRHFNLDGTYKKKDIERQQYLEGLGYKVIRVKL